MRRLLVAFLPLPPSANRRHGVTTDARGVARVYTTQAVRRWQQEATLCLNLCWQDVPAIHACRENTQSLFVTLTAYMTARQFVRRDADNLLKVTLDTVLNEYLAIDDVRITDLHTAKRITEATEAYVYLCVCEKNARENCDLGATGEPDRPEERSA